MTDNKWNIIQELVPPAKSGGRPRSLDMRQVINGTLYVVVGGIQWRMLFWQHPQRQSVYYYFRIWRDDGTWQRIHETLLAEVRRSAGRHKHPMAACLDSQSVRTTTVAGIRGYNKGKRVNGRKRHLLVDTLGLLKVVVATAASVQDRDGVELYLSLACRALARGSVGSGWMAAIEARSSIGLLTTSASDFRPCFVLMT